MKSKVFVKLMVVLVASTLVLLLGTAIATAGLGLPCDRSQPGGRIPRTLPGEYGSFPYGGFYSTPNISVSVFDAYGAAVNMHTDGIYRTDTKGTGVDMVGLSPGRLFGYPKSHPSAGFYSTPNISVSVFDAYGAGVNMPTDGGRALGYGGLNGWYRKSKPVPYMYLYGQGYY